MDLVDTGFVLICSALVFLMTPGLAFFYGGLVGRHNTLTIMAQNLIALGLVSAVWIVIGFSLAFGDTVGGIIGDLKYWLFRIPVDEVFDGTTIPTWTFFLFQMMFAVITPALITGAFVDRFRFSSYLIFICIWSVLVYSVLAHWVWGGGLLAKLGAIDFAGGTVVHISAGMAALATVSVLGARHTHTAPHDIRFVALGARRCCGSAGSASTAAARCRPTPSPRSPSSTPTSPPRPRWSPGCCCRGATRASRASSARSPARLRASLPSPRPPAS